MRRTLAATAALVVWMLLMAGCGILRSAPPPEAPAPEPPPVRVRDEPADAPPAPATTLSPVDETEPPLVEMEIGPEEPGPEAPAPAGPEDAAAAALATRARVALAEGRTDEAIVLLERALAVATRTQSSGSIESVGPAPALSLA